MEECVLNIHLVYLPRFRCSNVKNSAHSSRFDHKCKGLLLIKAKFLLISKNNQPDLVSID